MVMFELNSFFIGLIALVPTVVLAVFVERHYTGFWTAAWNAFAIFLAGISIILVPTVRQPTIPIYGFMLGASLLMGLGLIMYSLVVAIIGFKVETDVLRIFASSKLTGGILSASLVAGAISFF